MRQKQAKNDCCTDASGIKRPYHLCCRSCRAEMDSAARGRLQAAGSVPAACASPVEAGPARGRVVPFREVRVMPSGEGFKVVEEPYRAGCPGRVRDVFDVITDYAVRAGGAVPFTLAQVDAGRAYRALHERVAAGGVKCSSAFQADAGGGSGGVDFMDAYIAAVDRLEDFRAAIGRGVAKDVRRGAGVPGGPEAIMVRALVDAVCLSDRPLSDVLRAHGWRATGKNRKPLLSILRAALERMREV